jgi:hypothetical protein
MNSAEDPDQKSQDVGDVPSRKPTYAERSPHDLVRSLLKKKDDPSTVSSMSLLACDMGAVMSGYLKRGIYLGFDPLAAAAKIMRAIGKSSAEEFASDQKAMVGMCVWITQHGTKTTAKVMDPELYNEIEMRLERIAGRAGYDWSKARASKGLSATTMNLARFGQAAAPLMLVTQFMLDMYGPAGTSLVESPNAGSFVTAACVGDHLEGLRKFHACIAGEKAPKLPKANILKAVLSSAGAPAPLRKQLGFEGDRLKPSDFAGMESFEDVARVYTPNGAYKQPKKIHLFGRDIACGEVKAL